MEDLNTLRAEAFKNLDIWKSLYYRSDVNDGSMLLVTALTRCILTFDYDELSELNTDLSEKCQQLVMKKNGKLSKIIS